MGGGATRNYYHASGSLRALIYKIFSEIGNNVNRFRRTPEETSALSAVIETRTVSKRCKCGLIPVQQRMRIVGGREAQPHSRPWMAGLIKSDAFVFCGGTVLNNHFIVTAAHCIYQELPDSIWVVVGLHDKLDFYQIEEGRYDVQSIIQHPNYDHETVDNDIALIKLHDTLHFNERVLPACLPQANEDFAGVHATVSGWGLISNGGPTSRVLKEVVLPVYSYAKCKRKYPHDFTRNMMCAGVNSGGQDACQGDSGGPLVYATENRWFLIGIVSWGNGCAQPNQPGVYTNVTRYINWIYSQTQKAIYCV